MAVPDPPFNAMPGDTGLDIELMTEIAGRLGARVEFVADDGDDVDGLFDALGAGAYDCVAAGLTVSAARQRRAAFAPPYLISGQALAVDVVRWPKVRATDDLDELTLGVRRGDAGQWLGERLAADGRVGGLTVYDYGDAAAVRDDLSTGDCDAFITLGPVLRALTDELPDVDVVQRGITTDDVAIAVARADQRRLARLTVAQAELEQDGTLQRLRRHWLGNPYTDQSLAVR